MLPPLFLIGLLLLGGLTGCLENQSPTPPTPSQGASSNPPGTPASAADSPTSETPPELGDEALSEIERDLQELEAFMGELESEEVLDFSELLELQ